MKQNQADSGIPYDSIRPENALAPRPGESLLGSGLIDQSQKTTAAAMQIAEK
jgi:hypothetical protein